MKSKHLKSPTAAVAHLKGFFRGVEVTSFLEESPIGFRFRSELKGDEILVQAVVEPEEDRLVVLTRLLVPHRRPLEACQELVARLNTVTRYSRAVLAEGPFPGFVLESSLLLTGGCCLAGQVDFLGDRHLSSVVHLMPMIAQFSRGATTADRLILSLEMWGLTCEEVGAQPGKASDQQYPLPRHGRN